MILIELFRWFAYGIIIRYLV